MAPPAFREETFMAFFSSFGLFDFFLVATLAVLFFFGQFSSDEG
jgi:hypothetical protein